MALLEPKLCILDETDSGLDIDALKLLQMVLINFGIQNVHFSDYPLSTTA